MARAKARKGFVTLLLGSTLLGFGFGRAALAADQPMGSPTGPEWVIQDRFAHDPQLKDNQIRVIVDGDTATLKGTVDSQEEKTRAARLALVGPVRHVDNELDVGSSGPKAAVSDSALTATIKTRYAAEWGLKADDIHVSTNNGVVTLTGKVATPEMHERALELARSSSGVKRVDDQLRVAMPPDTP